MERRHDWVEQLHAALDEAAVRPFEWGVHDCCLFVADVVLAMTGEDLGAPFRGRYASARGAARALRAFGQGTIIRTMNAALGAPIAPALAQRGDVVLAGGIAGICIGRTAVFVGEGGLTTAERRHWTKAWGVGHG